MGRGDGQIRGTRTKQWTQVRVAGGDVRDACSDLADLKLLQKKALSALPFPAPQAA